MHNGAILVVENTDKDYLPAMQQAAGIIVAKAGMTSHAAIMGVELGIPVIVGADGVFDKVIDNQLITLDARRGRVFNGATVSI